MSNFPSKDLTVNAILDGLKKAKNNFLFWTNNRLSLSYAPKKIITINIAQEIGKIDNAPEIFIDAAITDILKCSLENRSEYLNLMNERDLKEGTFSITLDERLEHKNDEDSISKVIISVNNNVINAKVDYLDEIHRICKMLNRDEKYNYSSLEYGIFAFYSEISESARKKLNKRIPEIINTFNEVVSNYANLKASFVGGEIEKKPDKSESSIGCFIIEPFYK